MRLWHRDLISVLPRKQLLSQFRECVAIAARIEETGTPNHVLVNKILDFPMCHFRSYCVLVIEEMNRRGYKVSESSFKKLHDYIGYIGSREIAYPFVWEHDENPIPARKDWHNHRYLVQCIANLQEKYDCGAISEEEWKKIQDFCEKNGIAINNLLQDN